MKKLSMFLVFLVILSACAVHSATPMKPNPNSMVLNIRNNANFDYYTIEVNVQSENAINSGGVMYADGSKIEKGDILGFEYIDKVDFQLIGEKSFVVVLQDKDQLNQVHLEPFTIELAANTDFLFEITGDSMEDVEIRQIK
ncbi:hypothetical protein [Evansella tamaricis]|uniref:Uncharacterized protein n=1 Tax=Evansella tamaricis TaxID=2069301 RepID=A0ABS6JCF4_9BACI|nr:hypothetical protein [Evansella tamaricis]MBU9711359.1 hypothetical protein [Evansella tamaricis]